MRFHFPVLWAVVAALLLPGTPLAAQNDPLQQGVALYQAGRYAEAVAPLRAAFNTAQSKGAARPWLIAALGAARQEIPFDLQDLSTFEPEYQNATLAIMALHNWANNNRSGALSNVGWFCGEGRPQFDACARVKQMIESNQSPASPADWPRIAGLSLGAPAVVPAPQPAPQPQPIPQPAPQPQPAPTIPQQAPPAPQVPTPPVAAPPMPTPPTTAPPAPALPQPDRPLQVGESVIVGGNSAVWRPRFTVEKLLPATRQVQVRHYAGGGDIVACHSVARPGPADPSFFIGDWQIHVRGTSRLFIEDRDLYRKITGGVMLPPLRINPDGTYSWVVSDDQVIYGQWERREDAPGIKLMRGIDGRSWTLFETTEANGTTANTRDEIGFVEMETSTGHYQATRIGSNRSCVLTGRSF